MVLAILMLAVGKKHDHVVKVLDLIGLWCLFFQEKMMMMMNVGKRSCPPVSIMWCTFWPSSGRSFLPLCPPQTTGMVGPALLSPSWWLASWQLSLGTWHPILAAPSAWRILWLQSCLLHLELRYQVKKKFPARTFPVLPLCWVLRGRGGTSRGWVTALVSMKSN